MTARKIFEDAFLAYIRRIWIYLLFSVLITTSVFATVFVLLSDKFHNCFYATIFIFSFLEVLFSVYLIAYTIKEHPHKGKGTLVFCAKWATAFLVIAAAFRYIYTSCTYALVVSLCFSAIMWSMGSIVILSACNMLKKSETCILSQIKSNIALYIKSFFHLSMIFVVFSLVAVASAHPGKIARTGPSLSEIKQYEKFLFIVLIFLFIPLYTLTYIQLFEEITDDEKIN